jgi:hypothetical protein
MSGMIMGGMIGADRSIRDYEARVRFEQKMIRDRVAWERYENEFEELPSSKDNK